MGKRHRDVFLWPFYGGISHFNMGDCDTGAGVRLILDYRIPGGQYGFRLAGGGKGEGSLRFNGVCAQAVPAMACNLSINASGFIHDAGD